MSAVLERTIPKVIINAVKPRLITVTEYDRMIEAGIYTKYDRMELLNGLFYELTKTTLIAAATHLDFSYYFYENLNKGVIARCKSLIPSKDFFEPEPDIVLAKPPRENYLEKHPTPADILLVMETSDTTLAYDRKAKALAYSRNGIGQYLLLNLQNETLEDYREPNADGFERTLRKDDVLTLTAISEIKVDDLF